jgi:hypothetical protein
MEALNERGCALLPPIAGVLASLAAVAGLQRDTQFVAGDIIEAESEFL